MKKTPRIQAAETVIHGVLKIVWNDGFEGVVDLRPVIGRGKIFDYLKTPDNFRKFRIEQYGHSIGWIDNDGNEIDFGSDNLRTKAEDQARLHELVANMRV